MRSQNLALDLYGAQCACRRPRHICPRTGPMVLLHLLGSLNSTSSMETTLIDSTDILGKNILISGKQRTGKAALRSACAAAAS